MGFLLPAPALARAVGQCCICCPVLTLAQKLQCIFLPWHPRASSCGVLPLHSAGLRALPYFSGNLRAWGDAQKGSVTYPRPQDLSANGRAHIPVSPSVGFRRPLFLFLPSAPLLSRGWSSTSGSQMTPPPPGGKAKPGDPVVEKGAGRLGAGRAEGLLAFFPRLQWAQRPSLGRYGALCPPPASPGRQYASH